MDIHVEDLAKEAAVQYVASALIEDHVRQGRLTGNLPNKLLNSKERKLLDNIFKYHAFTDLEIEAAYVGILGMLMAQGYDIQGATTLVGGE